MLLIQSILIGVLCYLGSFQAPWLYYQGGWYTLSRPLVSGLFVGLVLGDVQTGVMVGVAIQAVYIALVTPGGTMAYDLNFVAFPALALGVVAVKAGSGIEMAVTIAATIGILGSIIHNFTMVFMSFFNQKAEQAIERGDIKGLLFHQKVSPQIALFIVRFIPSFLAVYYGSNFVKPILDSTPAFVLSTFSILGGVLPAVGIAILLKQIIKDKMMLIYFFVGFVAIVSIKLNMISVTIVGILLAYLNYSFKAPNAVQKATAEEEEF